MLIKRTKKKKKKKKKKPSIINANATITVVAPIRSSLSFHVRETCTYYSTHDLPPCSDWTKATTSNVPYSQNRFNPV